MVMTIGDIHTNNHNRSNNNGNTCTFCGRIRKYKHRCEEFLKAREEKRSRAAINREEVSSRSSRDTDDLVNMSLECKLKPKDNITRDFNDSLSNNITFPILVNNAIRTFSLLDCGATFSSIDHQFCLKNKVHIDYIKPLILTVLVHVLSLSVVIRNQSHAILR